MARPEAVGTTIPFCNTLAEIQALPTSVPVAFCFEAGKECLYYYTGTIWKRVAGRVCSVAGGTPLDMANGILTIDLSAYAQLTDIVGKASMSYVDNAIAALADSAPGALNTLREIDNALGNDPNLAATLTAAIATKADGAATTAALATKANTSAIAAVGLTGAYSDLTGKPTIPNVPVASVNSRTGAVVVTAADVGLSHANDTADSAYVDSATNGLNVAIGVKADTLYVDNAITNVEAEIALKADLAYVDLANEATTASLELKADATVTDDLQQKYDELNDNFLRLLKWTFTTFGQMPEGLEGQIEAALEVV